MTTQPLLFADALQRIGCALEPDAQDARQQSLHALFAQAQERQDLTDGVRYRFPGDATTLTALFGMIAAERSCCSSLRLTLQAEPQSGPLWLEITGPAEAVAALQQVFSSTGKWVTLRQPDRNPGRASGMKHQPPRNHRR